MSKKPSPTDFVPLTLTNLNQGDTAKEIETALRRVVADVLSCDDSKAKGSVTVTLAVSKLGENNVNIAPTIKSTQPKNGQPSVVVIMHGGEILAQAGRDQPLPFVTVANKETN